MPTNKPTNKPTKTPTRTPTNKPTSAQGKFKHARPAASRTTRNTTDWNGVADWYDQVVGPAGSEYHQHVVFPRSLKLLDVKTDHRVLDVACGQGAFSRILAQKAAKVAGIDASTDLIKIAKQYNTPDLPRPINYFCGDAREISSILRGHKFDSAVCLLALQNIQPIAPIFAGLSALLEPDGKLVMVMTHPCFRGAKESHWGWDEEAQTQYRRVDRYLLPRKHPITAHPGKAASGGDSEYTWTFHRPLESYVRDLSRAGFMIDAMEEWTSHKLSQPGARAAAENRSREEIPMFLAIRAVLVR